MVYDKAYLQMLKQNLISEFMEICKEFKIAEKLHKLETFEKNQNLENKEIIKNNELMMIASQTRPTKFSSEKYEINMNSPNKIVSKELYKVKQKRCEELKIRMDAFTKEKQQLKQQLKNGTDLLNNYEQNLKENILQPLCQINEICSSQFL